LKDKKTELPNKNSSKSSAQVGSLVVPNSGTGQADSTCESSAHRPTPKAKDNRPPPLSVRASDEQRAAIRAKAKAAGLSVNRYLLLTACSADLAPLRPSAEDRAERALALRSFRGTGTLLNQIARHLNSGRIIGSFDIAALLERHEKNAAKVLTAFIKDMPHEEP
jgi:hypothetical protein